MDQRSRALPKAAVAVAVVLILLAVIAGLKYRRSSSITVSSPSGITNGASGASGSGPFASNFNLKPDALIVTRALSEVPRDIVAQPVLKDILTDDFVFYYQDYESYLSLKGSLKRIAFEHDLTFFDEVLSRVLKTPAELALWKSYNGKLDEFMLVLDRNALMDVLTVAARIASDDTQLSKVSEVNEGGEHVDIYKLHYSHSRDLYFAGVKDKLAVFSNPAMPLPTEERRKKWRPSASVPTEGSSKHVIYLATSYLSFGYQTFFPALESIRFRFSEKQGWSTQGFFQSNSAERLSGVGELWRVVPKDPCVCFSLPVDSSRFGKLLAGIFKDPRGELKGLVGALRSPVAVCWYAESRMYTPLVVAKLDQKVDNATLRALFEQSVGNFEAGILTEAESKQLREQQKMRQSGQNVEKPVRATKFEPALPVVESRKSDGTVWSREVSSRWGIYDAEHSKFSSKMRSKRYFNVRMALWKNYLTFSPDDRLVDNAIAVISKKYPALSDELAGNANSGLVIFPGKLADLLKQATLESLPAEQESVFRESVSRRLFPAFERMRRHPGVAVLWPKLESGNPERWEDLKWQTLSSN